LVELLVVIAIIGILIGMLLPAVQLIRESARRTSCANKLRNISLAVLNYRSNFNKFPPGWTSDQDGAEPGYGWMAHTLPYVEQVNLHNMIDFDTPIHLLPLSGPRTQNFDLMFCPSSPHSEATYQLDGSGDEIFPFEIARTHYVGSIGSSAPDEVLGSGEM